MEPVISDIGKYLHGEYRGMNQGPWRITFDTNPDDCNMYCIMCEEHSEFSPLRMERITSNKPHRRMDIDILKTTVAEMVQYGLKEIIPSTMGEPLLYEHFVKILEICKSNGVKLNLTTNGTWPRYGPEKWSEHICPVARDVKVSWNGPSKYIQESIMKGSKFEKRLSDLRKFISVRDRIADGGDNRCNITLQSTFLELNLKALPDLVRLAIELGVDRVKGHHLWVHFPEVGNQDMRRSVDSARRWNSVVNECKRIVQNYRRSDGSKIVLDNFNLLDLDNPGSMPDQWVCPFLGREAWVNHEGRFDPCCAPDTERKKLGHFGKVNSRRGMIDIWNSSEYIKLRKSYRNSPICIKCTMRRPVSEVRIPRE